MNELEKEIFVLDFETTGLQSYDYQIPVEIAIYRIDKKLKVHHIYDSLIKWPKRYKDKINNSWWSKKTKVKFKDLQESPYMNQIWSKIKKYLTNKSVTSWNTEYDLDKFIYPMMRDYGKFNFHRLGCPMLISTDILQIPGYYGNKWPKLEEAAAHYEIKLNSTGFYHRADFDTHLTAMIIVEMINRGEYI